MICEEPWALMDLFNHVISNRANEADIDALIAYLEKRKREIQLLKQQDNDLLAFIMKGDLE